MNLELAKVTDISERFYGKWQLDAVNDRKFNADGTITYEAVEGFISPLKNMYTFSNEEQKAIKEQEPIKEEERDIDSRVYTNKISASLICKILKEKYRRKPALREIYFSLKNCRKQVSVHANIKDGIIYCTISTSCDKLRQHLNLGARDMILDIRAELRLHIYVTVTDEIIFGRA